MKIKDYLDTLSVEQLRILRRNADERIREAEKAPVKVIWHVEEDGHIRESFREEEYEKALAFLKKILDEPDVIWNMKETIKAGKRLSSLELPRITATFENEVEYEEWFK